VDLLDGVTAHQIQTSRLNVHWIERGPDDGIPVVLVHGNLSTGRFFEHLLPSAPGQFRFLAPDMRGFGRSDHLDLDATRGLRDWSDDVRSFLAALGIEAPIHLLGWSTGGAAISHYAIDQPALGGPRVASLTYIDPVSPFGFGGTFPDGTPCFDDYAGSGGGTGAPAFVESLRAGDRSGGSPVSIRNVMNASYWSPSHREPADREDVLVDEVLLGLVGDGGYPGDTALSPNWPGIAPGTRGILNALSPKYCNWSEITQIDPKPPVLWTHGDADIVVANGSAWEMGSLGAAGAIPGWPGAEVYPPQPMVDQLTAVFEKYAAAGGSVQTKMFAGSGHGPQFDAAKEWSELYFGFLESVS
jgi:pimeloyl-ACP methyl ester carboxylesterase